MKGEHWPVGIMALTGWQLLIGGVPIVLAWLVLEPHPDLSRLTWGGALATLYAATVALIFCFAAHNKVVTLLPATAAADQHAGDPGRGPAELGLAAAASRSAGGRSRPWLLVLAAIAPGAAARSRDGREAEPPVRAARDAFRARRATDITLRHQSPGEYELMADTMISRRAGDDRTRALDAAISQIERAFGKGSVMRLGAAEQAQEIETVSTGSLGLDIALGVGGLPRGRIIEIYGPESSGKTTLTLHVIAEAQKVGGNAAFIDAEHALDPSYAKKLGVNLDDLLISQPDTGEQALEIADTLVRSGAIDVIVVDSVAALVPKAELEGEMGDTHVGLQARLMSQALRKLTASISRSKCMLIFTNQIRSKIGVMFGSPETTTGGNALKFYASVRLDVRRIGAVKDREETVGNQTRVKVVKNKVSPPFRVVEFDIMYGEGVSKTGELIDLGAKAGVVEKSGSWFSYKSQRIGQGRENAKQYLQGPSRDRGRDRADHPRRGRRRRQGASTCSTRTRRRSTDRRRLAPAAATWYPGYRSDWQGRPAIREFLTSGRRLAVQIFPSAPVNQALSVNLVPEGKPPGRSRDQGTPRAAPLRLTPTMIEIPIGIGRSVRSPWHSLAMDAPGSTERLPEI